MREGQHYAKAEPRLSWCGLLRRVRAAWLILQCIICVCARSGMKELRYDILFNGELLPGFDSATVAANFTRRFKATPATITRLMNGDSHVLKRNTDYDTAVKYRSAMEQDGARALLREIAPVLASDPATPLTLAPAAGELLAAHERRTVLAAQVDTSHISLVSAFASAPEAPRITPPAPDTTHISVAEAGADLLPDRPKAPPPAPPDTSAITLAAAGALMAAPAEPVSGELPDISAITLAPPGAELESLRTELPRLDPDTSALRIEPLK